MAPMVQWRTCYHRAVQQYCSHSAVKRVGSLLQTVIADPRSMCALTHTCDHACFEGSFDTGELS